MARILVVDDQPDLRERLIHVISGLGEIIPAEDWIKALEMIQGKEFDVVVTDLRLSTDNPRDTHGFEVSKAAFNKNQLTQVIIITAFGDIESNASAMDLPNVFDYLERNNRRIDFEKVLFRKITLAIDYRNSKHLINTMQRHNNDSN